MDARTSGLRSPAPDHELFDGSAELFRGAVLTAGQFSYGTVDIGLAPEQSGAVVEDVEVVGFVALVLNNLQLKIGVIQSLVIS